MKQLFAAIAFAVALRSSVLACSCLPPPPPVESMTAAHAVFVGIPRSDQAMGDRHRIFEFEIVERFKGDLGKTVKVITGLGDGDCGIPFHVGARYLVYADMSDKHLSAHLCSRTRLLFEQAQEAELKLLRNARDERFNAGQQPQRNPDSRPSSVDASTTET